MGCKTYESNGYLIRFDENNDKVGCLCTFPHNYVQEPLSKGDVRALAMLGAAVAMSRTGGLAYLGHKDVCLPRDMIDWFLKELDKVLPND